MVLSYFPTGTSDSTAGAGRNLELTSWADISAIAKTGEARKYFSIGDTKSFMVGDYTYHARIVGFNHDVPDPALNYGSGRKDGLNLAGISFEAVELFPDAAPFSTTTSTEIQTVCWGEATVSGVDLIESTIHSTTLPAFYKSLPTDLSTVITPVYKEYWAGAASSILKCIDYLFVPSAVELGLVTSTSSYLYSEGGVYEFYNGTPKSRLAKYRVNDNTAFFRTYWTRSQAQAAVIDGTKEYNRFNTVYSSSIYLKAYECTTTDSSNYVSFAFCV